MAADFQKDIHEESSLTLRERIDEFFESVSLKWQEFLDWSDEKGLPLRKASDFFESKGIPALPALVILLLLLTGAAYVSFLSLSAPVSKTFTVNVRDGEGNSLAGASVQLQFTGSDGNSQTRTLQSNSEGKAVFENIPASTATVAVTNADFQSDSKKAVVEEGQDTKLVTFTLTRIDNPSVVIAVTVTGPVGADIALLYSNGSVLQMENATTIAQFQVGPNQNYSIVAKSIGYRDELKVVEVGASNINIPLRMFGEGEERTAPIYARVYLEDGTTPVSNATVKVLDESTGAVITSGASGEDGATVGLDVAVGRSVSISVSKQGYLTWFLPTLAVNEPEASVVAKLVEKTEENSKNIVITVIDDNGQSIEEPHIALYCADVVEEKEPRNGIAGFDVAIGKTCLASVSKDGFIPVQREITSATEENIILHRASSSNSGTVVIETKDKDGNTVAGVDVALFIAGKPLGLVKQTGIDGTVKFEFLPLIIVTFTASAVGQEGSVDFQVEPVNETGIEGSVVSLFLAPAKAVVNVEVVDHFTRNGIANAVVTLTSTNGTFASCTTATTVCSASIESGELTASISAPGFETLSTEFNALPGNNSQSFELISTELATDTELVFIGVFNEENQRVSVLSPATRYSAKYILKAVDTIDFVSAKAFVQIGENDVELQSGAAVITSFSSSGGKMIGGVDYSSADSFEAGSAGGSGGGSLTLVQEDLRRVQPTEVLSSGDLTPLPSTSGTSASLSSGSFKWVQFTFDKFSGTKELKVQFQTSAVENANVELFHRTEYAVALLNGSVENFHSPADKEAGVTKSALLAMLSEPNVLPIHFEGKCSETACLELWFEGASGKQSAFTGSFEATIPEIFKLNYRLLSPPLPSQRSSSSSNPAFTLTLQTDSEAVQLGDGTSTTLSRQVEINGDGASGANDAGDGFFAIKAVKFTNDASISFTATGPSSFEQQLHVAVSNAGNQLKVNVNPAQLNAFEATVVTFRVTDNFGTVVPNARVVLQKGNALASQVEAREETSGTYVAEISPSSFGQISYSIQVEGFKAKKGTMQAIAKKLVSIEPLTGLAVSIDSLEPTEGSTFTITNLVPDKQVKVSLQVSPATSPKYSTTYVSDPVFTLKGGETRTVVLVGRIKDNVIPFASQQNTLKENYAGQISLTASVVGFTQNAQLAFSTNAIFQVESFSQLLDYSADSLEFAIDLPAKPVDYKSIKVTNKAAKPVLINQQSTLPGVRITPVSTVIAPGETAEFKVTGGASPFAASDQCIFEDLSEKGTVEFIASFQGITTSKSIVVDVATTSHSRCFVPGGYGVRLPMDVNLAFPFGTIASKTNAFDGSQPVKLPNGELIVFSQGSQVTSQRAYVPAGVQIEISSGYVRQSSADEFEVRFPVPAIIAAPPQSQEVSLPDGSLKLSTLAADIFLPPGSQQAFQGGNAFAPQFNQQLGFNNQIDYQRFGSFLGGRSYTVQPLQPIRITAMRPTEGELFEITYDEDVYVDFPPNGQVQQSGSTVNAVLPTCTQLKVYSRTGDNTKEIKEVLPSSRQVTLNQATLNGRTAMVAKGGKISLKMCSGVDEESKLFQTKLRAPVTFVLPPGTPDPKSTALRVSYPNCAELTYRSGYSLGISSVKKIVFPGSSIVKPALENGAIEVEVPAEETIQFAPCRSITPSVSTFGGLGIEAHTKDNSPLVFTFSELDIGKTRTASQTICLVNKRRGIVSAVGDSFISSVTGVANEMNLQFESVKPNVVQQLSPSPKGECNNEFKLSGKIPTSTTDGVCVVRPREDGVKETITFTASDSTGWSQTIEMPVNVVVKHDEKACKRDNEKAASELLSGFFVDYSTDSINDRSGKGFTFTFKGIGPNHQRVLTLLNNYETPLSLQITPAPSLSCVFPPSNIIAAGDAVSVTCTPTAATASFETLKIKATGAKPFEKTVAVQIYNGDPAIYKNSPWGELAPGGTSVPPTDPHATQSVSVAGSQAISFATIASDASVGQTRVISEASDADATGLISQCSRHYCTYSQAQKAYDDFLLQLASIADAKVQSTNGLRKFCEPGANGGNYVKSTVIHLANTKEDFATKIATSRLNGLNYEVTKSFGSLQGCGVYKITARLDLCSGTSLGASPSENKANSKIQVIDAVKMAGCPVNVANAPLFLAGKDTDLSVFVGNELGAGFQKPAFLEIGNTGLGGGLFAFGPYENSESKADVHTVKSLMKSIYGDSFKVTASKPQRYENDEAWKFCSENALYQAGTILAASTAISAGAGAIGLGAGASFKVLKVLGEFATGSALSGVGEAVQAGIPGGNDPSRCSFLNGVIRSAVFGALSGTFASERAAASGLRSVLPSAKGAIAYVGIVAGATAGSELYSNINGGSPAMPPGAAGPTAYATSRTIGSQLSPSTKQSFGELFSQVSSQDRFKTLISQDESGRSFLKDILKNEKSAPGLGVFKIAQVQEAAAASAAGTTVLGQNIPQLSSEAALELQHEVNAFTGNIKAVKATSIVQALVQTETNEPKFLAKVYQTALATKGDDKAIADAVKKLAKVESDASRIFVPIEQPPVPPATAAASAVEAAQAR
ncbi:MAG: carboxypeptidase-like regulatory domain-containing protein, partial [Candidatus Micrarchaeota archaeon]|nr:carboxypeptidase-like regulatory domain-containing protein [Candidatus Micrarchaeota archaeon]